MAASPEVILGPGAWNTQNSVTDSVHVFQRGGSELVLYSIRQPALSHAPSFCEMALTASKPPLNGFMTRMVLALLLIARVIWSAPERWKGSPHDKDTRNSGYRDDYKHSASVAPNGNSLVGAPRGHLLPCIKTEGGYAYNNIGLEGSFHDLPLSEGVKWTTALTHTSFPVFYGSAFHRTWYVISAAYIWGQENRMLLLDIQKHMLNLLGTSRTYILKTSHHPFLIMPQEVADMVQSLSTQVSQ
ncbi:hypothetical protein BDV23DRAFT_168273 [Aspergillus alliaceus]|uniref:Alpha/Beta hydrolase protein n=1 Tax=Petromyces alliaceus TaxID=209559 RepID=A0A5N7CQJ0_PETAA|nr:hypothetical protein BDV23DRAFT_168273 [Aspergillus alliaceus]